MINLVLQSFVYVTSDIYFWPSMSLTTMMGIFIGAVIYNGDVTQIKKAMAMLSSYVVLLLVVSLARVVPQINTTLVPYKPISSATTIFLVTIFYVLGMWLGVRLVNRAHKEKKSL